MRKCDEIFLLFSVHHMNSENIEAIEKFATYLSHSSYLFNSYPTKQCRWNWGW